MADINRAKSQGYDINGQRERNRMTHHLKTWPTYYDAVQRGEKNFEVRKNDRAFQKGDVVVLERTEADGSGHVPFFDGGWPPGPKDQMAFRIGFVLAGGQFGLEPGYCVLSLLPLEAANG